MLDSGASVSLVREDTATRLLGSHPVSEASVHVVSATGEPIPVLGRVTLPVQVGPIEVDHPLVVVQSLIAPVILGIDFLQAHGLILDFTTTPVHVTTQPTSVSSGKESAKQVLYEARKTKARVCAVQESAELSEEAIDDCAIPTFGESSHYDMPSGTRARFSSVLNEYRELFCDVPGQTNMAEHFIPTTGSPIKIPPRRIPANYRVEVEEQLQQMLATGIIEESSSPWMAPMVFVRKKSGELRLCVDYRELNKRTVKDAYPLPRPDEAQDRLAGAAVFSSLDLRNGYWQLPIHEEDRPKTAFSPGPGLGLFQFCRMPFGLSGAPSSFQHLMDKVCRGLPFVTTYLDDVLVHSANDEDHEKHLREVFQRLTQAGLTLRGKKCHIGMSKVAYLGHIFSSEGMKPDPQKISAVKEWNTPTDVSGLRSFLGLASYYRRYIQRFADIAAPLHHLTSKGVAFQWDMTCQSAFEELKVELTKTPVLAFPDFSQAAAPFHLQTDASARGIGAVLEQDGHVIAYASRVLSSAERNYSVIQRECLAVVYALKQFRHYLLGRHFILLTDHAPLLWLSAQKMEGMLARWALAMQEYSFTMQHRKGRNNGNADALSRRSQPDSDGAVSTVSATNREDIRQHQQDDPVISVIHKALHASSSPPRSQPWRKPPLSRYRQLWPQLMMRDGIVCRNYTPGPSSVSVMVPLIPVALQPLFLTQCHDSPQAGHLGAEKTASRLRHLGYWVGMLQDVERHCHACSTCQEAKPPAPSRAPLTNIPIGLPWEMVAVDILQLPLSCQNNKYLLVIQDYFTKWAEAIPLPDQTANRITRELIHVFTRFGLPTILHSDQGANFESTILRQTLDAFGVRKSRTTAYHPQGDGMVERFNRTLLQMLRSYTSQRSDWEQYLPLVLFAYRSATHPSTGFSPFELMFGRPALCSDLPEISAFDPMSYQAELRSRLAEFRDLVDTHHAQAAHHQKSQYDRHALSREFHVGDLVWLSCPRAGKLDARWEGGWKIRKVTGSSNFEVENNKVTKVVHVNRLRLRVQPDLSIPQDRECNEPSWQPPSVEHEIVFEDSPLRPPPSAQHEISSENPPTRRYPQRERRPPERLLMTQT